MVLDMKNLFSVIHVGVYFSFQLRLDGYKWSYPFSIDTEGVMCISLKKDMGGDKENLRVEVRSGTKSSCFEVIFRPNSSSSPYRFIFFL